MIVYNILGWDVNRGVGVEVDSCIDGEVYIYQRWIICEFDGILYWVVFIGVCSGVGRFIVGEVYIGFGDELGEGVELEVGSIFLLIKIFKYELNFNIDDSFNWDVDRNCGAEVWRSNNGGVESDFGTEFWFIDGIVVG